ncbi:MAG: two pore domain potassium channel family protein [Clostridia bacterium]|nr:two pore domain potassium channel family protein [Clostridia bacterium]
MKRVRRQIQKRPEESRKHQIVRTSLESGCYLIFLLLVFFALSIQMAQILPGFLKWAYELDTAQSATDTETLLDERQAELDEFMDALEREEKADRLFEFVLQSSRYIGILYMFLMIMLGIAWIFTVVRLGIGAARKRVARIFMWLCFVSALVFLVRGYDRISATVMTLCCSVPLAWKAIAVMREKRSIRSYIFRGFDILLIILNVFFLSAYPVFILIYLFFHSARRIIFLSYSHFRMDVLMNIIRKTNAIEILIGMGVQILFSAILLAYFDPGIPSIGEGLWYCFAIVTTIGFGDVTATSLLGRILSVLLGIYGIIVVALITSIVVNFYTEIKNEEAGTPS